MYLLAPFIIRLICTSNNTIMTLEFLITFYTVFMIVFGAMLLDEAINEWGSDKTSFDEYWQQYLKTGKFEGLDKCYRRFDI